MSEIAQIITAIAGVITSLSLFATAVSKFSPVINASNKFLADHNKRAKDARKPASQKSTPETSSSNPKPELASARRKYRLLCNIGILVSSLLIWLQCLAPSPATPLTIVICSIGVIVNLTFVLMLMLDVLLYFMNFYFSGYLDIERAKLAENDDNK